MSKYKLIQTEYRNFASLKKALADLNIPFEEAANPTQPTMEMYGYQNDLRPQRASIVIRRDWLNKNWSQWQLGSRINPGASNDIGFAWNGSQFAALVSEYDQDQNGVVAGLQKLQQRYAFHEVNRQARAKGYTVRESRTVDGAIEMVLVRR